jgi:hypothetical protein
MILICGLSASLFAVERQVGVPLSSLKSRVLKSVDSVGLVPFHDAASLSVTSSKVTIGGASAAGATAVGAADSTANVEPANPANKMNLVLHARI